MKQREITFHERWTPSPLSYWTHIEAEDRPWGEATTFTPPLPKPVPGRGYPRFLVEVDGVTFQFASLDELQRCIDILSQKLLPTTMRLAAERGGCAQEKPVASMHWLSQLPLKAKPWRYRAKAVKYLAASLEAFRRELRTLAPRTETVVYPIIRGRN